MNLSNDIIVVDIETTGLDPVNDQIVEIAAIKMNGDAFFHSYVKIEKAMSLEAYNIHKLIVKDLELAPKLERVMHLFSEWLPDNPILCGHNIQFDLSFIKEAFRGTDRYREIAHHAIDIWSIAYLYLHAVGIKLEKYNLDSLSEYFAFARPTPHDAISDAMLTKKILRIIYKWMSYGKDAS